MTTQLPLPGTLAALAEAAEDALYAECAAIVARISLKEASYLCDTAPSTLSAALRRQDRHYLRAEWVLRLAAHAPDTRLAELIAAAQGARVVPAAPLTLDEKLRAVESALSPAVLAQIYAGARK